MSLIAVVMVRRPEGAASVDGGHVHEIELCAAWARTFIGQGAEDAHQVRACAGRE
jgi:hypothetical protein